MNTESCFFECLIVLSVMLNGGGRGKVPEGRGDFLSADDLGDV
jgi:hypothetical protein